MTNLDGNAIQEIERLVHEAETVIIPAAEQRGVYYLRERDGSYTHHRAQHDPVGVVVYDLESLCREIGGKDYLQAVYVSDTEVAALFDDTYVRWQAKVALPHHPSYLLAKSFTARTAWPQKELVRLLRTELSAAVGPSVIDTFASLRFTNSSDTNATVKPMSAGLERSIHQEVRQKDGMHAPEFIDIQVPVFDIPDARRDLYPVRVFVDYDHDKGTFILVARQDDLRLAQEAAVIKIIGALEADLRVHAPVVYGTPR